MKRVVTGVTTHGRSFVESSEEIDVDASASVQAWRYQPGDLDHLIASIDERHVADSIEPEQGGFTAVIMPFAPRLRVTGSGATKGIDADGFHTTRTIDVGMVLGGRVTLILDEESVDLCTGDIVVQRATRHAWHNPFDEVAHLLVVLHTPAR